MRIKQLAVNLLATEGTLAQKTIRGGFWVFFSFGFGRILDIVRSIILARLLTPADFGLMGMVNVVTMALIVFTTSGVGPALIHRRHVTDDVLNVAWAIGVLRGVLLCGVVFGAAPLMANFFGAAALQPLLQVIAFTFLTEGFVNIGLTVLQKELNFKTVAGLDLGSAVLSFAVTVVAALILRNVWALAIGALVEALARLVGSYIVHSFRPRLYWNWQLAKELLGYGKHLLGSSVVYYFLTQGDDALVGKILGTAPLGLYGLAYRLSNMPATNITQVVSQVTFPAFSQIQEDLPALRSAYLRTLRFVALIAVPMSGGMFALAPEIVGVVYGDRWLPMVPAFMILCFYGLERSIGASTGTVFLALGKPHLALYLNVAKLVTMAVFLYPLTRHYGILGTSIAVTISAVVVAVAVLPTAARLMQCRLTLLLGELRTPFAGTMLMVVGLFLVKRLFTPDRSVVTLLGLVGLGALIYGVYVFCSQPGWVRRGISLAARWLKE